MRHFLFLLFIAALYSCSAPTESSVATDPPTVEEPVEDPYLLKGERHFVHEYPATLPDGQVNLVVEIPAGTLAKWEVNKESGSLQWEMKDGKPRVVQYLGYPGNYGMVPQTLLPKEAGGDGDPLDVLLLGEAVERGTVLPVRIIGVLKLLDRGEQDDKLIAVHQDSPFGNIARWTELEAGFPGVSSIVETWFSSYKGPGKMESLGYGDETEAQAILETAIQAYQQQHR